MTPRCVFNPTGRSIALLSFACLCALTPAYASAEDDPDTQYRQAQQAYNQGQYGDVIELLRPLLYPFNRLSDPETLLDAHKMLGVSFVFEKDVTAAETSFMAILAEQPTYRLDPLIDPPAAVELFEKVKQRNSDLLRQIDQRQVRERERRRQWQLRRKKEKALAKLVVEREVHKRHYWVNFVPFGAGQFQNGQRTKGWLLVATQLAMGALSVSSAIALRAAYPDNRPPEDEVDTARAINVTQVVSGALFWGLVAYGIIDALAYYQPVEKVIERRRDRPKRYSLSPAVGPGSAQATLSIQF